MHPTDTLSNRSTISNRSNNIQQINNIQQVDKIQRSTISNRLTRSRTISNRFTKSRIQQYQTVWQDPEFNSKRLTKIIQHCLFMIFKYTSVEISIPYYSVLTFKYSYWILDHCNTWWNYQLKHQVCVGYLIIQCTMGICAASFEKFKVEARSEVSASKLRQNWGI